MPNKLQEDAQRQAAERIKYLEDILEQVRVRLWRGKTAASIRRACKEHYKGCRLEFGNCFRWTL